MKYEVEQKFPVADFDGVAAAITEVGGVLDEPETQVDTYLNHPGKDFAATDEALRIRQAGGRSFVTYKGPKVDAETKTRREIELPLAEGADVASQFVALFEALGFRAAGQVSKRRRCCHIAWEGFPVEVALDEVDEVGTFVELEIAAGEDDVPRATAALASLARRLRLNESERRSYLELRIGDR